MNKPHSILVVEDDLNDTCLFKRAFSQAGIGAPVVFVRDGQEVIDYLSGEPPFEDRSANPWPALVILDLVMPRVSGFEVLAWMRRDSTYSCIPVLAFSGIHNPTDISRAYSLGVKFFLLKTCDVSHWATILHCVVDKEGDSQESP
jgi:CheY-like chemotaxis protein